MEDKKKYDPAANLRSLNTLPPEEAQAIRSKGGKAAQAKIKRRKTITAILDALLAKPATEEMVDGSATAKAAADEAKKRGLELDAYEAVAIAQVVKAAQGDTRAAEWVRDSAGDKPTEKQQITADLATAKDAETIKRLAARLGMQAEND